MVGELYAGLDVHKPTTVATILDAEEKRVDQFRSSSADSELVSYLRRFPAPLHVVLEAYNVLPHIYDAACSAGADATLVHPYKVRVISEASLKSDRVNSEAPAQLLRLGSVTVPRTPQFAISDSSYGTGCSTCARRGTSRSTITPSSSGEASSTRMGSSA
jgi:hypothetical protein